MAAFTVILAILSCLTLLVLRNQLREMHEGGVDTHALADDTEKMKDAAEKSAQASRDFADTAKLINSNINLSVDKLNENAKETGVLAKAATIANDNSASNDRPWITFTVQEDRDMTSMSDGSWINVVITNSGKRPALVTKSNFGEYAIRVSYVNSVGIPKFGYGWASGNDTFVVAPGVSIVKQYPHLVSPPTYDEMLRNETFRLYRYAFVDYVDVSTNKSHTTHYCISYVANTISKAKWNGCPFYNDAS
jgi:hypothetical protein